MDINELLAGTDCECGRRHDCDIKWVYIEKDAARHLVEICRDYKSILLIADENTYSAAKERTLKYLSDKKLTEIIFEGDTLLLPDEEAISAVMAKLTDIELIIGIGSGVIQDLSKYVSGISSIPYLVVATAPSMDGYASSGAAMILEGMKVTVPSGVPMAIIADTEVLKDAPIYMIKAGYGDVIGKYSALNDWRLGAEINGEYFCPRVYALTMDTVKEVLPLAKRLLKRDPEAIKSLMDALVLVGIAMSFVGNSRPASGSEHHLSHFFEITGLVHTEPYFSHGIDVIYSTAITSSLRRIVCEIDPPEKSFRLEKEELKKELERIYGPVGESCLLLQERLGTYSAERCPVYREKAEKIKEILKEAPTYSDILKILDDIELDIEEFYTLYGEDKISDAIKYAKDLKDRYSVLWLVYDLCGGEI